MNSIRAFLTVFMVTYIDVAFAASDPLAPATGKAEAILAALTGKFAIAVIGIVVAVTGFLMINGNVTKKKAYEIVGGSVLIYGATTFAAFLMSK